MLNSAFDMAPKVERHKIKYIFCDDFITPSVLQSCQLSHASIFYDHYHLDLNFQKNLGLIYSKAKSYLYVILNLRSSFNFETTMNCLISALFKNQNFVTCE